MNKYILIVVLGVVAISSQSFAQDRRSFDVEKYVKGLDKNGNGLLDTNEVSSRTSGWLKKEGFDTSQAVSVSKILRKLDKKKRDKERVEKRESNRKVPGFGVEAEEDEKNTGGVSNFASSDSGNGRSSVSMETKYGKKVMEQVQRTLDRYDRNKNGVLDKEEVERARWGSPTPKESDKNRDGALSKTELADRYSVRERASNSSSSSKTTSKSSSSSDRSSRSSSSSTRSSRFRPIGSSSKSTSSSSSSAKKSFNSGNDKYLRYAEGLIKQYDKNKDGKISKSESREMRRPPTGADTNKDGYITKDELIDSLSGKSKTSTSSSEKPSSSSSRFGSRGRTSSSKSRTRKTVSFTDDDKNQDGQLQMHEYADEWDQKVLEEFRNRDLNNDGVITAEEWSQSRG